MTIFEQLKAKREERKKILDQAGQLIVNAKDGKMSPEQEQEFDKRHADGDAMLKDINRLEKQWEAERSLGELPSDGRKDGMEDRGDFGGNPEVKKDLESLTFRSWLKGGVANLTAEQRSLYEKRMDQLPPEARALSASTGASGGYTVPTGFYNQLEVALKAYGGIVGTAEEIVTDAGNTLPFPTMNDTGNTGARIAESAAVATNVDPTYGVVNLSAYMYTSKTILVPVQLLDDSAFNVEGFLAEACGIRLARIINTECTTGTGSSQPNGIVTASAAGVTTAGATAITYNEVIGLIHSVDPLYRVNGQFMFHDNILLYLRKLADSSGRPLWIAGGVSEGIQNAVPDTFAGYKYVINQDMASAVTTGLKTILFGALNKYKLRRVKGVQMVRFGERYMDNLQIGVMAFHRADGNLIDAGTNPVKRITQA